jgi:hypothetical protein
VAVLIDEDPEFSSFWRAYPRKIAKGDARKAWAQTKGLRPGLPAILGAIACARSTEQWTIAGGKYIPHPSTWLRGERWDDHHEIDVLRALPDGRPWWESTSGVEKRAMELGIRPWDGAGGETFSQYAARVRVESEARKTQSNVEYLTDYKKAG